MEDDVPNTLHYLSGRCSYLKRLNNQEEEAGPSRETVKKPTARQISTSTQSLTLCLCNFSSLCALTDPHRVMGLQDEVNRPKPVMIKRVLRSRASLLM